MLKKLKFITRDYVGERERETAGKRAPSCRGLPLPLPVPLPLLHFDVK